MTGCAAAMPSNPATTAIAPGMPSRVRSGGRSSPSRCETLRARSSRNAYAASGATTAKATNAPSGDRNDISAPASDAALVGALVPAAGLRQRCAAAGVRRRLAQEPERELEIELRVLVRLVHRERAAERARREQQEPQPLAG